MMRARQNRAMLTLSVRSQLRKRLSVNKQKQKNRQQLARKSLESPPEPTLSFKIAIESVSFYAYYPHRSTEKFR